MQPEFQFMDQNECLNRNMSHEYIFARLESGIEDFVCRLCGHIKQEFADSQP